MWRPTQVNISSAAESLLQTTPAGGIVTSKESPAGL